MLMIYLVSPFFFFSDNLTSTYNAHTSSTLACDIHLPGCTNCTDVVSEMTRCEGVMHTYDNYWVSCNSTASSGASITTDSNCSEDMTVLNAKSDQGYTPNDVGIAIAGESVHLSRELTFFFCRHLSDRQVWQMSRMVSIRRASVPSKYASPLCAVCFSCVPLCYCWIC